MTHKFLQIDVFWVSQDLAVYVIKVNLQIETAVPLDIRTLLHDYISTQNTSNRLLTDVETSNLLSLIDGFNCAFIIMKCGKDFMYVTTELFF
jgi:hypothetical protein